MTNSIERPLPDCLPCLIFRFLRRPLLELLLDERLQWRLAEVTQGRAIDEEARRAIHPQRPHVGDVLPQHLVDGRPIGIRSRLRHVQADVANDVPDQQRLGPVMRGPLRLRSQRPLERLPATRRRGPDDGATTTGRRRQGDDGRATAPTGSGLDFCPRHGERPDPKDACGAASRPVMSSKVFFMVRCPMSSCCPSLPKEWMRRARVLHIHPFAL